MFSVIFSQAARADVIGAGDWYESIVPGLGAEFREEVNVVISKITENPYMYAAVSHDLRRALLYKFSYGLFFQVGPEIITVVACFHSGRNPKIWKERFKS